MRRTYAALVAGALVAAFAASNAWAVYHPGLGVFMQRDPGEAASPGRVGTAGPVAAQGRFIPRDQYSDGPNLYQYVGCNPVNFMDPLGLWKIRRDNGSLATASPRDVEHDLEAYPDDDTIRALARRIGLDHDSFREWLTVPEGGVRVRGAGAKSLGELTLDDRVCNDVQIPNTVLAHYDGEFGVTAKVFYGWYRDKQTLRRRGFLVEDGQQWTACSLEYYISQGQLDRRLHGIFIWAHGNATSITTDASYNNREEGSCYYSSNYSEWKPSYRMGLGIVFACKAAFARPYFADEPSTKFWGLPGALSPMLDNPPVSSILPPGAQGTRE